MKDAYIIGTGVALPDRIVTNEELAPLIGWQANSIFEKTGIRNRRWADADMKTTDLAGQALTMAVGDGRLNHSELEYLILGTMTPDRLIPGGATTVQSELKLEPIPCLEIRNACCNAVYGLQIGASLISAGVITRLGMCFAEIQSRYLSLDTNGSLISILFGDGGSAMILSDSPQEGAMRLVDVLLRSEGEHVDALGIRAPGTAFSNPEPSDYAPRMNGRIVIANALKCLCEASVELLAKNGLSVDDLGWIVPHQANANLLREFARKLNFPLERVVSILEDLGNTSSASIGLALHELRGSRQLASGEYILMPAFGAGFTWGAALIQVL